MTLPAVFYYCCPVNFTFIVDIPCIYCSFKRLKMIRAEVSLALDLPFGRRPLVRAVFYRTAII